MMTNIQKAPAFELWVEITDTHYGKHLRFLSRVPTANNPELRTKFEGLLSVGELRTLRDAIDQAISE